MLIPAWIRGFFDECGTSWTRHQRFEFFQHSLSLSLSLSFFSRPPPSSLFISSLPLSLSIVCFLTPPFSSFPACCSFQTLAMHGQFIGTQQHFGPQLQIFLQGYANTVKRESRGSCCEEEKEERRRWIEKEPELKRWSLGNISSSFAISIDAGDNAQLAPRRKLLSQNRKVWKYGTWCGMNLYTMSLES